MARLRLAFMGSPDFAVPALRALHAAGSLESFGFEARCLQHEIDHLDGILFLDRVDSLVDDLFRRRSYASSGSESSGSSGAPAISPSSKASPPERTG